MLFSLNSENQKEKNVKKKEKRNEKFFKPKKPTQSKATGFHIILFLLLHE